MKPMEIIVLNRRLTPEEIGKRKTRTSNVEHWRPCDDGFMRDWYSHEKIDLYGELSNPRRNKKLIPNCKYSYIYDYVSEERDPEKSPEDLQAIIIELFTTYNIHEFMTNLQGGSIVNRLDDYYLTVNLEINYDGLFEEYKHPSLKVRDWSVKPKHENIEVKTIDETNQELQEQQDSDLDTLIFFWMGGNRTKRYSLNIDFSQIEPKETIQDYIKRIKIQDTIAKTVEEAYNESKITLKDMQDYIESKKEKLDASQMSTKILTLLFDFNPSLIHRFSQASLPVEIKRKYMPNQVNVKSLKPDELQPSDLPNVLNDIVLNTSSYSVTTSDYYPYFKSFSQDREASLDIIRVLNIPFGWACEVGEQYTNAAMSGGLLTNYEVRDLLLDEPRCEVMQLLRYDFNYDSVELATKLLGHIATSKKANNLKDINRAISMVQRGGVGNDKILEALRTNNFHFAIDSSESLEAFNNLGISGITIADLSSRILDSYNFRYLRLANSIDENEVAALYNKSLSEMKEQIGQKEYIKDVPKYRQIYSLILNYGNTDVLFSILPEEEKKEIKKVIIDYFKELSEIYEQNSKFSGIMKTILTTLAKSFSLSSEDLIAISTKAMDLGISRDDLRKIFEENTLEQDKESLLSCFDKANFYPCPEEGWGSFKRSVQTVSIERGENWDYIKNTVKSAGKCFVKISTDLVGNKDGKQIPVDNLSKWLFGVPGQKGHIIISKHDGKIIFPNNTPQEAIEIVNNALVSARKKKMTITPSDIAKVTNVIPSKQRTGRNNLGIPTDGSYYTLDG